MTTEPSVRTEIPLLALLALLWGSSYLFTKVAVAEIPPFSLIALRVAGAAAFLVVIMALRRERLPRDGRTWCMLQGLGDEVAGQIACLTGAALYAGAALYGRRFGYLSAVATAAGTMIWAAIVLVPIALVSERPCLARFDRGDRRGADPRSRLYGCGTADLFPTGRTIGSMGVASRSYLRAGIGVLLGVLFLGETISPSVGAGIVAAMLGVA